MSRTRKHEQGMGLEDLRQQLAEEAQRLRSLGAAVRASGKAPVLEEYIRSGRGPAYQRDNEAWMKNVHVAYAFEEAAWLLEQTVTSARLASPAPGR